MDALMNIPKDVKNTHLRTALWYKDNTGQMENISETRSIEIRPINDDFSQSCEVEMTGFLHLDLCTQRRAMIGGIDLKLTLYPADPKFYLMYDSSLKPEVVFKEIKFEFHRAKVHPAVASGLERVISKDLRSTVKYPITRKEVRNFIIQKDSIEFHENNVIKNGRLPRKCFIAFVSTEAYNGHNELNPLNFKHYNIRRIRCTLNCKDFPARSFECNFDTRSINKVYRSFYEAMGQIDYPRCNITKSEYLDGYAIFGFNFQPDLSDGMNRSGYCSVIQGGDMSIHIDSFGKPIPETASMLVYLEYDNLIEIPATRIPFKDFN